LSLTVTVNEQLSLLPEASVILYFTVVTPLLKVVPLASLVPDPVVAPVKVKVMIAPGQLSEELRGAIPFTAAVLTFGEVFASLFPGQAIVGF
jgi:hypothetical protein